MWLIFCFVVLWTAFPEVYASITLTLFVPLTLAALGIVLRGSSFAFRKAVLRTRDQRRFGAVVRDLVGARAVSAWAPWPVRSPPGGSRPAARPAIPWTSWINPTSILGGVLAVVVFAYLAAVYLICDARRLGDDEMVEYFRRRAVGAAVVAGVVAAAAIPVLRPTRRTYLFDGLTSRALPLVIVSHGGRRGIAGPVCRRDDRFAARDLRRHARRPDSSPGASRNGRISCRRPPPWTTPPRPAGH